MTEHEQFAEDLALHALGALEGEDWERLNSHLESCSACRRELQELRRDMGMLGLSSPVATPPARSRERLLRGIAREPRQQTATHARAPWWSWIAAATTAAFAASTFALWRENSRLQQATVAADRNMRTVRDELVAKKRIVALLTASDATQMILSSAPIKRQPQARVIYQKDAGRLLLLANELAPLPIGKTYELWLLPSDGKAPIPAGLFKPNENGYSTLIYENLTPGVSPKAFAVTVEPESGSSTPTMPIVMVTQAG
jgi:anti-sigma-K factor RskA